MFIKNHFIGDVKMTFEYKIVLFAAASIISFFVTFKPVILPKCACCGKIKFRTFFKYIFHEKKSLTRKGQLSVCKACCKKYNIHSIADFKKKHEIRKRMEYKNKYL